MHSTFAQPGPGHGSVTLGPNPDEKVSTCTIACKIVKLTEEIQWRNLCVSEINLSAAGVCLEASYKGFKRWSVHMLKPGREALQDEHTRLPACLAECRPNYQQQEIHRGEGE
jgi:hypothetical protein